MNRKDELIHERDRLVWLLTHTAAALNEGVREAIGMSYNQHLGAKPAVPTDEEGLEYAVRHLKNKAAVGVSLLKDHR